MALRYILSHPAVSTVIPGMRRCATSSATPRSATAPACPAEHVEALKAHRWDVPPPGGPRTKGGLELAPAVPTVAAWLRTKAPRVIGVNHVALEVDDVEAAVAFYSRLFDIRAVERAYGGAFLDLGDQFIALFPPGAGEIGTSGSSSTTRSGRVASSPRRASSSSRAPGSTSATRSATASRSCSTTRSSSSRHRRCSPGWACPRSARPTRRWTSCGRTASPGTDRAEPRVNGDCQRRLTPWPSGIPSPNLSNENDGSWPWATSSTAHRRTRILSRSRWMRSRPRARPHCRTRK